MKLSIVMSEHNFQQKTKIIYCKHFSTASNLYCKPKRDFIFNITLQKHQEKQKHNIQTLEWHNIPKASKTEHNTPFNINFVVCW